MLVGYKFVTPLVFATFVIDLITKVAKTRGVTNLEVLVLLLT